MSQIQGLLPVRDSEALLSVRNLKTQIETPRGTITAVDSVSFELSERRSLGIVGETGSGKTMTALSIMQLLPTKKARIVGGTIEYHHKSGEVIDIVKLRPFERRMRDLRSGEIALVFQSSLSILNPVYTVGAQIRENILANLDVSRNDARDRAMSLLKLVGISAPQKVSNHYPHQLSGGMRQRALIAIALSAEPRVLIADEPTTALDVTIQAQIVELILDLQRQTRMGLILITHDLGLIAQTVDDVLVMYMGDVVEFADVNTLFSSPKHPYTIKLLESIIRFGQKDKVLSPISGSIPNPTELNSGCKFYSRCPSAEAAHETIRPLLVEVEPDHFVRCSQFSGKII